MSKQANVYSAATHVHNILTEHLLSLKMVQGVQAQEEWSVTVQSLLDCSGTIIANTNLILHMRSILTCIVANHLGIAAASSSTLHCGSPELHSGVQTGCYHVSDPSEVTLQPCHRRTFESEWQETVPIWTQSTDSVCCNMKLHVTSPSLIYFSQSLPFIPTLEAFSTLTTTQFLCGKVITVPQVHHNPKGLFIKTLRTVNRKFIKPLFTYM